ncbi:helix-turn-helix domain-containing protein [Streptomyces sp. NPDC059568]|uniref:helix-turn-helix domain-containing protein n=1 Tax=Streptomyces sp. NPDC059568 TaxID=3346868 RepID=UPI0036B70DC2
MSTDFQQARAALGLRLRELREAHPEGRLTGSQLAERLGWSHSKISKLETGKQTATAADLQQWAEATGRPGAAAELQARLAGLESHTRSWRRQLAAGHRSVQDAITAEHARTTVLRIWENCLVAGMVQTAEYARHVFDRHATLMRSPRDTEDAVRARVQRQEGLYDGSKRYHIIMWEAALHALVCPPSVLAAQLDRLAGVIGLDTVELGIVPFNTPLKIHPGNSFWLYDERLVVAEDWHAELWIDDPAGIATYIRVWDTLRESAVYDADAHRIITRARRALGAP